MRSIYVVKIDPEHDHQRLRIQPGRHRYNMVYPFVKSRDWYLLHQKARQGIMDEHIEVGTRFPSVKLNTAYSFGLDDQEFMLAFETDEPSDFVDLVMALRETDSSRYTVRDTPIFTCLRKTLPEVLDSLGG
jgi:chlorite dismutase